METYKEKLKDFIRNNPPFDKDGEPTWWSINDWLKHLDKLIPNWRELLNDPEVWEEIKGIKPRRDYDELLEIILRYAPPEKLKEYLESEDDTERNSAYRVLIKDNAKKLTSNFWKLLNADTKIWLLSKIVDEILEKSYFRFLREVDILIHDPEYFFQRMIRRGYIPWIYHYIIPLVITEIAFYEGMTILHPLWIKVKSVIEQANDLLSMKKIEELEQKFKEILQRIIEKLKPLLQFLFWKEYPFVSKNILFDPSLLLDYEKAKKVFSFMRKYHKKFNFFISNSFYKIVSDTNIWDSNIWYKVATFFEYEEKIRPKEMLGMLEEYRQYFTFFEIPSDLYQEKYAYFYKNLREEIEDQYLVEILFEEWIFLQEFSWIVAKSKKTFEKFKEAGAAVIEFSEKAVDKLIRRTLKKKDDDFINTFDKLRALGKWIAVGGSSATSLLNPLAGTLISFGIGIFLLLDPEDDLSEKNR